MLRIVWISYYMFVLARTICYNKDAPGVARPLHPSFHCILLDLIERSSYES